MPWFRLLCYCLSFTVQDKALTMVTWAEKAVESLFDAEVALNDIMLLDQNMTDANRQLTQLETDFANKQRSVNEDTSMAAKIAGTVGAATMNAENAKDSATETMKLINDLLQSMGNPATIDTTKLEHVENSLQIFKNQWINELESSFQQLTDAAAGQKQKIAAFDRDIVDIRGDIRNLELIRDTLPTGCYNTAAVERP
ncbi:laminin subunit gamma-1-like [Leucoraja erinacea]|uniref:laminin subunit gamma-1-like n=1 Tax=Leucoraja erinaceus TaxID=7782 RepID=UPI002454295F|nr:laminin subunit gamma-1-like [Leucoraja erinacea]